MARSYVERPGEEPVEPGPPRGPLGWWGIVGAAVFAGGAWTLSSDLEGVNAVWYLPAWYGYLLMLDAIVFFRNGTSFLAHRRRELGAMMVWSVPFWYLFELANVRLANWYYVFVLRTDPLQEVVGLLAFATVLPACFLHAELLSPLPGRRESSCRPWRITRGGQATVAVLGVVFVAAPLLFPRHAFPLVWLAPLGLAAVPNYRRGSPSLLADLEAGRPGRLYRLLAGGMLAGLAWESLNYWARSKWIYTVPGFESFKLFEMPLPGFLGFPVLAVSAFSAYSLLCGVLRRGRHWEQADSAQRGLRPHPLAVGTSALLAGVFVHLAFGATLEHTVRSRRPLLEDLRGLGEGSERRLRAAGIPTPERLVAAVERQGLGPLAGATSIPPIRLEEAWRHGALALHKGMGTAAAGLLLDAGVSSPEALAEADPGELYRRLVEEARKRGGIPPRPAEVRVWIRAVRLYGDFHR